MATLPVGSPVNVTNRLTVESSPNGVWLEINQTDISGLTFLNPREMRALINLLIDATANLKGI